MDRIAKLIPETARTSPWSRPWNRSRGLKEAVEEGSAECESLFEIAKSLEGLARHASTHAAGVVIANKPLDGVPSSLPGPERRSHDPVCHEGGREAIGLVKFDFLGLKTLTVVDQTAQADREEPGNQS